MLETQHLFRLSLGLTFKVCQSVLVLVKRPAPCLSEGISAGEPINVNMITLGQHKYRGQILGGRHDLVGELLVEDI